MFCRDVLKRGTRIATALALVAAVIVSPIRSSKSAGGTSRLRQNLAISLPKPTPPSMTSVSSPSALVKALASENEGERRENEEERTGTACTAFCCFDLLAIYPFKPARNLAASRPIPARHPLRC